MMILLVEIKLPLRSCELSDILTDWYKIFVDGLHLTQVCEIVHVADYLCITPLIDLASLRLSSIFILGSTSAKIQSIIEKEMSKEVFRKFVTDEELESKSNRLGDMNNRELYQHLYKKLNVYKKQFDKGVDEEGYIWSSKLSEFVKVRRVSVFKKVHNPSLRGSKFENFFGAIVKLSNGEYVAVEDDYFRKKRGVSFYYGKSIVIAVTGAVIKDGKLQVCYHPNDYEIAYKWAESHEIDAAIKELNSERERRSVKRYDGTTDESKAAKAAATGKPSSSNTIETRYEILKKTALESNEIMSSKQLFVTANKAYAKQQVAEAHERAVNTWFDQNKPYLMGLLMEASIDLDLDDTTPDQRQRLYKDHGPSIRPKTKIEKIGDPVLEMSLTHAVLCGKEFSNISLKNIDCLIDSNETATGTSVIKRVASVITSGIIEEKRDECGKKRMMLTCNVGEEKKKKAKRKPKTCNHEGCSQPVPMNLYSHGTCYEHTPLDLKKCRKCISLFPAKRKKIYSIRSGGLCRLCIVEEKVQAPICCVCRINPTRAVNAKRCADCNNKKSDDEDFRREKKRQMMKSSSINL
jgi:hypothetical protein